MPPLLRDRFRSKAGQREFKRALVDKDLLVREAYHLGYHEKPDILEQVDALEQRLIVKAMLKQREEEFPVTEAEAKAYYEANKEDFAHQETVRIARVIARHDGTEAKKRSSKRRAEQFRKRLLAGEDRQQVMAEGDGPERVRKGDMGFLVRGEQERVLQDAAFTMTRAGQVSSVVAQSDGYAVLVLLERRPARPAVYSEVAQKVKAAMMPGRQRKVFDSVVQELRLKMENSKNLVP